MLVRDFILCRRSLTLFTSYGEGGYKRVVLSMSMGPDETSEGFYLGELVVVMCPWGGGGEKGTHKKTISQILCSH